MTRRAFTYSPTCSCNECKVYEENNNMKSKRNKVERFLDRYNHLMEFIRTIFALTTIILQLIILSKVI